MIVDWVMNQKKMPANTSAELSPNDSPFQSPTSPLQAINPPPVNSISAPAAVTAADPMNAPPAGQTPTSPLATLKPNPIPTATIQLSDTGLNLEFQIQRIIEREIQKSCCKSNECNVTYYCTKFYCFVSLECCFS